MAKTKTLNDCYDYFLETEQENMKEPISRDLYRAVCYSFIKKMLKYIIYEAGTLRMNKFLGSISIRKYKQDIRKKLPVNYKLSKELGETVYHTNEHTDGYRCRIYWNLGEARFKNKSASAFKGVRDFTREVSRVFSTPSLGVDYHDGTVKIVK